MLKRLGLYEHYAWEIGSFVEHPGLPGAIWQILTVDPKNERVRVSYFGGKDTFRDHYTDVWVGNLDFFPANPLRVLAIAAA